MQALVMPKKRSGQVGQLLDAVQGIQCQLFHLALGVDELAADASLDIRPDPRLVRVELGRVRWQEEQLEMATLTLNVLQHPSTGLLSITTNTGLLASTTLL